MKQLQAESGMSCSIRKSVNEDAQERIMTIRGNGAELEKGINILTLLMSNALGQRAQNPPEVSVKLLCYSAQIGAVIGKAGATINEIRQSTSASISVASDPLAGSTEQLITITGAPAVVTQGVLRLVKLLYDNPVRPYTETIDYVPGSAAVSSIGGLNAASLPPLLQQALAQWVASQQTPAAPIVGRGGRKGGAAAAAATSARGRRPARASAAPVVDGPSFTSTFVIPSDTCSTVIGRGGENVKAIRLETGCIIEIRRAEAATPDQRVVNITGNQQMVAAASARIQRLVQEAQTETTE